MSRLHEFHFAGDDVTIGDFFANALPAFPDTDSSDDVDVSSGCQKIQIGDLFAFPRSDMVPGVFDDRTAILSVIAALGYDEQGDGPCRSVVLDVGVPDCPLEFDLVEMFHCGQYLRILSSAKLKKLSAVTTT